MRRTNALILSSFFVFGAVSPSVPADETPHQEPSPALVEALSRQFHLDGPRAAEERFYESATVMTKVFTDGKKQPAGAIRLLIQAATSEKQGKTALRYSCRRLEFERSDGRKVTVPALEEFTYQIEPGVDAKKQVLGIEHAGFLKLKDSSGKDLTLIEPYLVYNTFIDFHAFNDVMASVGLRRIGDSLLVDAGREIPVHLGDTIQDGSVYRLGESRARLNGIGLVNNKPTAVVSFDSGDSSFLMKLALQPKMIVEVQGFSRFEGIVQIDLASNWPALASWKEIVISEARSDGILLPGGEQKMIRVGTITALAKKDFEERVRKAAPK